MTITLATNQLCYKRQEKIIFASLSFQLNAGGLLFVEGANGTGKSSLLRLLAGLYTPANGDILWCGRSIFSCYSEYKQEIHYIGHSNGLRLDLTGAENLVSTELEIVKALQIMDCLRQPARQLSAGQKRKLSLAKLFVSRKKIWLLDEPLTALDVYTQTYFITQLEQHLATGGIAVMSSHQPIVLKTNMQRLTL